MLEALADKPKTLQTNLHQCSLSKKMSLSAITLIISSSFQRSSNQEGCLFVKIWLTWQTRVPKSGTSRRKTVIIFSIINCQGRQ
jgi:hypothetical protein